MENKSKNDIEILQLKETIRQKKEALATLNKFEAKTNLSLEFFGQRYNLNVCDKDQLLLLLGLLNAAQKNVVVPIYIGGFKIIDWVEDIEGKLARLNIKQEEARLKELEKRLHNLLSNDTKVELELDDLKKQLS